jgi:arylformamidase
LWLVRASLVDRSGTVQIFDITRPVHAGTPVWPGDATVRIGWTTRIADGAATNGAELCMSVHTGTHMDGPLHVLDGAPRVGDLPLEAMVGPAFLADVGGAALDEAWAAGLLEHSRPVRLLVRTGCWGGSPDFPTSFPAPTEGAARVLVEAGVRLFGTDAPSVDPFDSVGLEAHRVFCGAGVAILENLLLDLVPPGTYELIALPLRLAEADSSPVRAVLRGG